MIYNSQILHEQRSLWRSFHALSGLGTPGLLTGDFNAILGADEHKGGSFSHYASKVNLFADFLSNNSLLDFGFSSSSFTWCNGQAGLARHWARLDHFLANFLWLQTTTIYLISTWSALFMIIHPCSFMLLPLLVILKKISGLKSIGLTMRVATTVWSKPGQGLQMLLPCIPFLILFQILNFFFSGGESQANAILKKKSLILKKKLPMWKILASR